MRVFDLRQEVHHWWSRDRTRINCDEFVNYQRNAMKFMPRLGVSLLWKDGLFWWTPSVPIRGGPPWSQLCLAQVWICIFLHSFYAWVGVVVWSVNRSGSRNAVSHFDGKLSRDPVYLPSTWNSSPSVITFAFRLHEVRVLLLDLDSFGGTDLLGMFPLFFEEDSWCSGPSSRCGISAASLLVAFLLAGEWLMSPNSKGSNFLLSCQLQINFLNTYTVLGFWASGVGLSWAFYGMQRCASNHPIRL